MWCWDARVYQCFFPAVHTWSILKVITPYLLSHFDPTRQWLWSNGIFVQLNRADTFHKYTGLNVLPQSVEHTVFHRQHKTSNESAVLLSSRLNAAFSLRMFDSKSTITIHDQVLFINQPFIFHWFNLMKKMSRYDGGVRNRRIMRESKLPVSLPSITLLVNFNPATVSLYIVQTVRAVVSSSSVFWRQVARF